MKSYCVCQDSGPRLPDIAERKRRYAETRKEIIKEIRNGANLEDMIAVATERGPPAE